MRKLAPTLLAAILLAALPAQQAGAADGSSLTMSSGSDDWVGAGRDWSYTAADATFEGRGNGDVVDFRVRAVDATWHLTFDAPDGAQLTSSTTYRGATRWPFNESAPGLSVWGDGRACNVSRGEFTVEHATFTPDDLIEHFQASFVQYCDSNQHPLTGTVEFDPSGRGPVPAAPPAAPPPADAGPDSKPAPPSSRWLILCRAEAFDRTRIGTAADDRIAGSRGDDLVAGLRDDDRLSGRRGDDCLVGGQGLDILRGGGGRDTLVGGRGADRLVGGAGADRLLCGRGERDVAVRSHGDVTRGCERVIVAARAR